MKNIAVIGFGFSNNYGAVLTNYALIKYLEKIGYNPIMVEKPRDLVNYNFSDENYQETLMERRFINKHLKNNLSVVYKNKYDLKKINNECDIFITGSDQVWSNTLYKPSEYFTFLSFVNKDKKKISYASSLGHNNWACSDLYTEYDRVKMQYNLNNFDFISVREDSAQKTLKEQFNLDCAHVLDSVFLLEAQDWGNIILSKNENEDMFVYYIEPNDEMLRNANVLGSLFTKTRFVSDPDKSVKLEDYKNLQFEKNDAEDWISNIRNSKFVVTNSFHGVCFSIIFKKEFIYIIDDYRKDWTTRVESLLKALNIKNRIYTENDNLSEVYLALDKLDYGLIYDKLNQYKDFSKNWLSQAIVAPKKESHLTDKQSIELIHNKLDIIQEEINALKNIASNNLNSVNTIMTHNTEMHNLLAFLPQNLDKYKFIEKLFSIKNKYSKGKKKKVLTILGIKITI